MSPQETFARVERLNITHLHGSVGSITRSLSADSTKKSFGNMSLFDDVENLRRVSEMIDIIYEVDGNGKNFNNLREDIKVSKNIIFLGFGFGKENMGRLDLANTPFDDVVRIFATTYGITANELDNYLLVEMRELNRKLKERSNIIQRGIRADLYHYDLNVLDFMRNNLRQEVYK